MTSSKDWYRWFKHTGREQIRNLLMAEWDPIGVADEPEARSEYDAYIGLVADRLRRGEPIEDVAAVLDDAERNMGLKERPDETRRVAALLGASYADAVEA